jgi:carbon storage regulator CsrA
MNKKKINPNRHKYSESGGLHLTMKFDEKIKLNDLVTIHLDKIGSNQVEIRFEAPKEVNIYREKYE